MTSGSLLARDRRWLGAAIALVLVIELIVLGRMDLAEIVRMVPDDSFFYLIIAQRLRDYGEFSFDGIHPTYGFQPLYQLVSAALAVAIRDPVALLHAALVLGSVLHVACAWILFHLALRLFGRAGAWGASLFWLANPALLAWFWGVKENGLYTLLLFLVFHELVRICEPGATERGALRLGILLGLAELTRVNFMLPWAAVAVLLVLGIGWRRPLRARVRLVGLSSAAAAIVVGPWFLYAWRHFGTAMPTSGMVKLARSKAFVEHVFGVEWMSLGHFLRAAPLTWNYVDLTLRGSTGLYGPLLQGVLLAAIAGWVLARRARGQHSAVSALPIPWSVSYVALAAAVNAFSNALLLPQYLAYAQWYTAPEFVALGVGVAWAVATCWRHLRSRLGAIVFGASIGAGVLLWTQVRRVPWSAHFAALDFLEDDPHGSTILLELSRWIREHVPESARVGIRDPGVVTYFSQRRLIPIDPLVQSYDFLRARNGDIAGYARDEGLSYVFGPGVVRDGRFHFLALPDSSYEVVWVPYPAFDLGWQPGERSVYMLVRPLDTPGPAFLGPSDFEFGAYEPQSPEPDARAVERRRRIAAALEGFEIAGDLLRIEFAPRANGGRARARLWIDGELARDSTALPSGWIHWDVRKHRGRRARIEVVDGSTNEIVEVHAVDLEIAAGRGE